MFSFNGVQHYLDHQTECICAVRSTFYPSAERGIVIAMSVCPSVCGHDNLSILHPIVTKLGKIVDIYVRKNPI